MTGVYRLGRNPALLARAIFGTTRFNSAWPRPRSGNLERLFRAPRPPEPRRGVFHSAFTRKTALAVHVRPPLDVWHQIVRSHPRIRTSSASFVQTFNSAWPRPRSGRYERLYRYVRAHPRVRVSAASFTQTFNSAWPQPLSGRHERAYRHVRAHPRIRTSAASLLKTLNSAWPQPRSGRLERAYRHVRVHPRRKPIFSAFQRALSISTVNRRQIFERFARLDWEPYRAAQWHLRRIGGLKTSGPPTPPAVEIWTPIAAKGGIWTPVSPAGGTWTEV